MQAQGTQIEARAKAVIAEHIEREGPLLPILHGMQDEFGCVPQETLPVIAEALNLSRAEVYGVMTFYHDFREQPAGRHVIKLCRAEACQSVGGDQIAAKLQRLLGISFNETTADGSVTLDPIYCIGLCACAPAALVDGVPVGRLDDEALDEIVAEVRA
ncbi:formate dehydrogenase subunit gamma [Chelativorans sp. ZYF759]|uniref:formate dehydrogenase subunit gamma n=1 Tax=Chelativorans sp. ZYF759 TaxID=2692213 RepID=UPI00145C7CDA|nr:formate dehydrogenase subunit gamma [Chelativorans sp. ZYF759]NMG39423.1 formate dehydrogenase subunit gamma [Chelativorans sp. ZYF759]